jgi:hypothetical protein
MRVFRYLVKSCTKQLRIQRIPPQAFLCEPFYNRPLASALKPAQRFQGNSSLQNDIEVAGLWAGDQIWIVLIKEESEERILEEVGTARCRLRHVLDRWPDRGIVHRCNQCGG